MKEDDMFWYFLMRTALNEDESIKSLYNKKENLLVKVQKKEDIIVPICRYGDDKHNDIALQIVSDYKNLTNEVYILSPISKDEKVYFLSIVMEGLDTDKKRRILSELNYSNLHDGGKIIIRVDYTFSLVYWQHLNDLLKMHYEKFYYPAGITKDTEVI